MILIRCAVSAKVILNHPCVWCNSNRSRYFPRAYGAQGIGCGVAPPRHSVTTVVEFPIERTPTVVCLSYGKPREIPRCGCYRNRHGMTLGVEFWRRYWHVATSSIHGKINRHVYLAKRGLNAIWLV